MRRAIRDFVEDFIESFKEEPFSQERELKQKITILTTEELQGRNRVLYHANEFLRSAERQNIEGLKEAVAAALSREHRERQAIEDLQKETETELLSQERQAFENLQKEAETALSQIQQTIERLQKAREIEIFEEEITEETRQMAEDDAAAGIKSSPPHQFFKPAENPPQGATPRRFFDF